MNDQECILEKLSNDFGLNCYGDSGWRGRQASISPKFQQTHSNKQSVNCVVNVTGLQMEIPEIAESSSEQNGSSEDGNSATGIARSTRPFPVLNRVAVPSGSIQPNQSVGRIVLSTVGGIQNALMHSEHVRGGLQMKNSTLVPFEIHEGGGMPAVSDLAAQEPVVTIRGGCLSTKKLSLRDKARNAEIITVRPKKKQGNVKRVKTITKVIIGRKTHGKKCGVQTETLQTETPTAESNPNSSQFKSSSDMSSNETYSPICQDNDPRTTSPLGISRSVEKNSRTKNCHSFTADLNLDYGSLSQPLPKRKYIVRSPLTTQVISSKLHSATADTCKTASAFQISSKERDANNSDQVSNQMTADGKSDEDVLYSSDDELSEISNLLKTSKKKAINANTGCSSSANMTAVKSILPPPQNHPVRIKKVSGKLLPGGINKEVGKQIPGTFFTPMSLLQMPASVRETISHCKSNGFGEIGADWSACTPLQSALKLQKQKTGKGQKHMSKSNVSKTYSAPTNSLDVLTSEAHAAGLPCVSKSVRSYLSVVDEVCTKMIKNVENVVRNKPASSSPKTHSTIPSSFKTVKIPTSFQFTKVKKAKENAEFRRRVLLLNGLHSSRTLGFSPLELSLRGVKTINTNTTDQLRQAEGKELVQLLQQSATSGESPSTIEVVHDSTRLNLDNNGDSDNVEERLWFAAKEKNETLTVKIAKPLSMKRTFQDGVHSETDQKRPKDGEPENFDEENFRCPFCRKTFFRKERFVCHTRTHSVSNIYPCPTCGRSYSTIEGLQKHVVIHNPPKIVKNCPFHCKLCNRKFKYKIPYEKHLFRHTSSGTKFFLCEKCDFSASVVSKLNRHIKQEHKDEKRYKCKNCIRLFLCKENLIEHRKTHIDVNSSSKDLSTIKKLFKQNSPEVNIQLDQDGYTCELCGKVFNKVNYYRNHVRLKHRNVPFKVAVRSPFKITEFVEADRIAEEPQEKVKYLEVNRIASSATEEMFAVSEEAIASEVSDSAKLNVLETEDCFTSENVEIEIHHTPDSKAQLSPVLDAVDPQEDNIKEKCREKQISEPDIECSKSKDRIAGAESSSFSSQGVLMVTPPADEDDTSSYRHADIENDTELEDGVRKVTKKAANQQKNKKKISLKRSKSDEKKAGSKKTKDNRRLSYEGQTKSEPKRDGTFVESNDEPQVEIRFGQYVVHKNDESIANVTVEVSKEEGDHEKQKQLPLPAGDHGGNEGETSFLCEVCSEIFPTVKLFEKHLLCHIEEDPDAVEARNAIEHLKEKHGANVDCSVKISAMNIFECEECKKTFSSEKSFEKHQKKHGKENSNHLSRNLRKITESENMEKEIDKYFEKHGSEMDSYACKQCMCMFSHEIHLKKHIKVCHTKGQRRQRPKHRRWKSSDPSLFTCNECGRLFKTSRTLNTHQQNHENQFACIICGMIVLLRCNIRRHVESHFDTQNLEKFKASENSPEAGKKRRTSKDGRDPSKKRGKRS